MNMPGVMELSNCFAPNVGGVETHLSDLVKGLSGRGWRVNVVAFYPLTTRAPWKRYEETSDGVRIWRLWWFGHNWFHVLEHYPPLQFAYLVPRLFWGAFWWLVRHRREVSVIHAHGLAAAFCARILGAWFGKRTVLSSHAIYNVKSGTRLAKAVQKIIGGMDAVITLSSQSRDELIAVDCAPQKISRYCYWVDLDVFSPGDQGAARRALGLSEERPICLFVGRLIPIKGVRVLLELAQQPEYSKMDFILAGVGPLEKEVTEATRRCANIRYAGNVNNSNLAQYYRAADVLCVPSQYQEGFGRVIIEALGCGTPVIGADCQGIREATTSDVAWLTHPTAEGIGSVLRQIILDRNVSGQRRPACRQLAEERYSLKNIIAIENALKGEHERVS